MPQDFNDTIPGTDVKRGMDKDDLIVITGAGGFIAGSLTRYFAEQGYTNIRAIDRKPLPDWYLRVPGVESICCRSQRRGQCHRGGQRRDRGLQPRGRHGRHGLHRELPRRVPALDPGQHAPDRGLLPGRRGALLLQLQRLRLQHRPAEEPRGHRAQGVGRLSGHGRARLRLGEAGQRDVLPGVLGGARPRDPHRPLPQHLRPQRHLVRRPREGARRDVPQGPRGPGQRRHEDRDLGRRRADPLASATSTTASTAST